MKKLCLVLVSYQNLKDDQYELKVEKNEVQKYLIPTAEVSLTNLGT